jgi:ubiquinone/menaquinone biosynthesis C-methylase UbiE
MSMTQASSEYFGRVAGQWDTLRSGYFRDGVREAAIAKAYLRPEMVVADVGAGTGFLAAALAPLVRRVYVVDGSPAMLAVAKANLKDFDNLVYQEAESRALPLPDDSLDAVFANMYLHHCPDPLAALQEMARILRPGGRLVLTDMDAHTYTWLKDEMADLWLGFERAQVGAWLKQAGLVNRIVMDSGQSCCAMSPQTTTFTSDAGQEAQISIFLAAASRPVSGVHAAIQEGYGAQAEGQSAACCSPANSASGSACCGGEASTALDDVIITPTYSAEERAAIPNEAAEISLGCGNPIAFANLRPGETILDIGSGGGIDAFLAARAVGPEGKVIGVDMTPAMLARARKAAQKGNYTRVSFRKGQAEALPVAGRSVDVVISNCVVNLCEDKGQVFAEAFRVLKPGGRLEVSDMVTSGALPGDLREDPQNWASCIYGALPEQEYLDLIAQAGFTEIHTARSADSGETSGVKVYSLAVSARKALKTSPAATCGCGANGCS